MLSEWRQSGLILLGSALGGLARFWLAYYVGSRAGFWLPWGTFAVNLAGSFLIGFASHWLHSQPVRFLAMVGFCGGFTTFSSFSLESLQLIRQGDWARAALYAAGSVLGCVALTAAGFASARWIAPR